MKNNIMFLVMVLIFCLNTTSFVFAEPSIPVNIGFNEYIEIKKLQNMTDEKLRKIGLRIVDIQNLRNIIM